MLIPVQLHLRKETFKKFEENICFLIFCLFFFPNILFVLFLVCPTILLAIQLHQSWPLKIELTQRYEFNRQS